MHEASGRSFEPEAYNRHAGFVSTLGATVLDWLAPRQGERILDLGCGDGALGLQLRAAGAHVLGLDASPAMVEAARARGLLAEIGDGEALTFKRTFDAVFSNAALHWMRDADAVVAGVARALVPGGRFVAEQGGHGNVAAVTTALRAVLSGHGIEPQALRPWSFPTVDEQRERLEHHGFVVESIELAPRPTPLPTGIAGWLEMFGAPFLDRVPPEDRACVVQATEILLAPSLQDSCGRWTADYVRLRFRARLAS